MGNKPPPVEGWRMTTMSVPVKTIGSSFLEYSSGEDIVFAKF